MHVIYNRYIIYWEEGVPPQGGGEGGGWHMKNNMYKTTSV